MQIFDDRKLNIITLKELELGDTFLLDGDLYIVVRDSQISATIDVFCITTNSWHTFEYNTVVELVECEIKIVK